MAPSSGRGVTHHKEKTNAVQIFKYVLNTIITIGKFIFSNMIFMNSV